MDEQKAQAVIISCIDHRTQDDIDRWVHKHFADETFDRVAFAGGILDLEIALGQIEIAKKPPYPKGYFD